MKIIGLNGQKYPDDFVSGFDFLKV